MGKLDKNSDSGTPSLRLLRVSENLRHAISEVLIRGDINDAFLEKVSVTVSEVRASPDLRHAVAFVMPLGGDGQDDILTALNSHAKYIRGQVGKKVRMKYLPRLVFRLDESFDEATHITALLNDPRVSRDIQALSEDDEFVGRLQMDDDE